MLVREVMSNEAITVPLGTTVKSALAVLSSARITSLPVVGARGSLRGIVSEADLIRDGVSADARLHEIPRENVLVDHHHYVDDVMTTHVLTVGPDSDLAEAIELMTSTGVKSLPVVAANRRVLGVVSRSDVVHLLARADHDLERDVDAALASVGLRDWMVEVNDGTVELGGARPGGRRPRPGPRHRGHRPRRRARPHLLVGLSAADPTTRDLRPYGRATAASTLDDISNTPPTTTRGIPMDVQTSLPGRGPFQTARSVR